MTGSRLAQLLEAAASGVDTIAEDEMDGEAMAVAEGLRALAETAYEAREREVALDMSISLSKSSKRARGAA